MITKKEQLYNKKVKAKHRNYEIVKLATSLGYSIHSYTNEQPINAKYLFFHDDNQLAGISSDNVFDTSSFGEITVEELLGMEEYKVSKEFILEAHKAACSGWKSKLEKQFPGVFVESKTYAIKDKVIINGNGGGEVYTLVLVSNDPKQVVALGTDYGRFRNPVEIQTSWAITHEEMIAICGNDFKLKE